MNVFDEYTGELLDCLNEFDVDYIIVGGYAVNFHGYRRTTGDIDLWIKPDNGNRLKIISAFRKLGIDEDKLKELENFDFTQHLVFSDGEEPFKIDFITYLSGIKYQDADQKKIISEIDGIKVPFIDFNNLVLSKFVTGRPKDKIDIEELQKIRALKK